MPISIDIPEATNSAAFDLTFQRLDQIDRQFSTYKPTSEVSRFAAGHIDEPELSAEVLDVLKQCRRWQTRTDGYFSAWANKTFDPSGYVKGWAIAEAGKLIDQNSFKTYCIAAGGDILARSDKDKVWQIGLQDPRDKNKIFKQLSIKNGAVCTSGNYERGHHIVNPKNSQPAQELLSATVSGPDIIEADVLATACFAAGSKAPQLIKKFPDYSLITVE